MLVPTTDVQTVDELRRLYRRSRAAMLNPVKAIGRIPALPPEPLLRSPRARCGRPDWGSAAMLAMLCQVDGQEDDPQPAQLPQSDIVALADLRRDVCRWHGISLTEFKRSDRPTFLARARAEFYFLAYKLTKRSFSDMIRFTGAKNHTTAIHGVKAHKTRLGVRTDDSVEFRCA